MTVVPLPVEKLDSEQQKNIARWQKLAQQFGAHIIVEEARSRKTAQIIIDTAERFHMTQIVLGHSARSR
ncbi:hypothetical protein [Brevibacillus massiliensis]|uniref:hypothetical protein n=1 Tax=Brevibacillus massiliensis TaxID=1118054 RepID=UPI00030409D8|nr:hypothetical protein [Brevibacillus massiliensis]